jgi:hypothetical protein
MRGLVLPWWAALPERGYRMRCWFRGRGFCVRPARASAPAWLSLRTRLTAAQARESPGPRLPCACQLGGRRVTPRNNGADERTRTADLLITNQKSYSVAVRTGERGADWLCKCARKLARREGFGEKCSAIGPCPIADPAERYRCGPPTPRFEAWCLTSTQVDEARDARLGAPSFTRESPAWSRE